MAEAKLGRPNNKKRWGTLVEAAKTANVKKMLSKSKSEESLSSGNEGEPEQEPLNDGERTPDDKSNNESQELENKIGIVRSGSGGLSPLDPSALDSQHLTEKYRTIRPPKTSVSFDENSAPASLANESSADPLMQISDNANGVGSPSLESRSLSPALAVSESCEPLMKETSRLGGLNLPLPSSQNLNPNRLSPSNSEPPTEIRSRAQPANGSLQASRIPGIQPINRQMSAGWL